MLVLARKLSQRVVIRTPAGEEIVITIVDIGRSIIRLGIEAPREVQIFRQELLPLDPPSPITPTETPE